MEVLVFASGKKVKGHFHTCSAGASTVVVFFSWVTIMRKATKWRSAWPRLPPAIRGPLIEVGMLQHWNGDEMYAMHVKWVSFEHFPIAKRTETLEPTVR